MAPQFIGRPAGIVHFAVMTHLPIGPYSNRQVLIGLVVLAALIVIVAISIWRRDGRK